MTSIAQVPSIAVVTGLAIEARIARTAGVRCVASGSDPIRLATMVEREIANGAGALLSFGIAGALIDLLRPGSWIIARAVVTASTRVHADGAWTDALRQRLPGAVFADIAGTDAIASGPAEKRRLHEHTGAAAVDTESHVVAHLACEHGLPFAVFRVVSDPVHRFLPPAACAGLDARGRADARAVLRALASEPRQTLPLARSALDAARALRALSRGRRRLGPRLGYPDLGELLVDVA